ncbi:MmgE/PrpD family protein [Bradyrhizobium sp. PMVTL-01]|uniref:MmgE/PrpD family protein n=1 Tax=Bradyrhizobium sp. PMVTL-01 TaxID=3434999 RepID=UPI003F721FD1
MPTRKSDVTTAFAEILQSSVKKASRPLALQAAKERILDALSVTFDGLDEPASGVAFRSIHPSVGPCTLIGRNASASPSDAAFVNAVGSHVTAQADCGGGGHPGTFVIPVALAIGELRRSPGIEVLNAIAVGYEAAQRMHTAVGAATHANGFRALPTIGVFGAAATASILSRLDIGRFATALNLAADMAGGIYPSLADGTMELHFQAGLVARAGITAAALAEAGGEASAGAIDGPHGFIATLARGRYDARPLTQGAAELALLGAKTKPFPACMVNLGTMLLIRSQRPEGFVPSDIERISLTRPAGGWNGLETPGVMNEPPYRNALQAQMSAKFTAVSALLGKPIREFRHYREACGDPDIEGLARKMSLRVDGSEGDAIALEVTLRNGQTVTMRSADARTDEWEKDIEAMFERLASPRLGSGTREVLEHVGSLEAAPDISRLMQLVRGS